MSENKTNSKAVASFFNTGPTYKSNIAVWNPNVDKLSMESRDSYMKTIKDCRFFFRHEPFASSVVTKMVDLAINGFVISDSDKLTKTEEQLFEAISRDLLKFLRKAAFEYLITGLVVPEVKLTRISKQELRDKGVQRIDAFLYPTDLWVRDSQYIEIKKPFIGADESYFLVIPDEVIYFISTGGTYEDGSKDVELYKQIVRLYPEFVDAVKRGEHKILLENPLIVKYTTLSDTPYPTPYLYSSLESFKHKRNMRRMDYSVAARVISAILHVTAGNDEYPLTEDQEDFLNDLETKFRWRDNLSNEDVERVFALFTNHTVEINWIFPEIEVLLNEAKYEPINKDIVTALGFPRILITGETDRSFTSDSEVATLSPLNTLNVMREALLPIVKKVFYEVRENNKLSSMPDIKFKPISLISLQLFYTGISELYASGNISRQSYAEAYGYDFNSEIKKRAEEQELIVETGVQEFAPVPHSNTPNESGSPTKKPATPKKETPKKEA